MKQFEGYLKKKLGNSYVLLAGGGNKTLSDFIGSLNWDSTNRKLQYKAIGATSWTDLVTFGSNALNSTSYLPLTGGTLTGVLRLKGSQIELGTSSSSSNDSADIVYLYGNGNEKCRLWTDDTYTTGVGPNYRVYKSDGMSLYSGRLATVGELSSYLPLAGGTMSNTNVVTNLNADLLDGYHASAFGYNKGAYNYDANEVGTHFAAYRFSGSPLNAFSSAAWSNMLVIGANSDTMTQLGGPYNSQELYFRNGTWNADGTGSIRTASWNKIWHDGNDGSGSGLDADLLDGQHGSYYATASSLENYLPIAGNSTSNPITGTIYIKDVNAIILNSNNKDLNIWEVYRDAGAWASQYGFNLQYKGADGGNNNDLILWAHNQTSTHKEVYRVHQDGTFIFKATPYVGTTAVSLNGHTHPYIKGPDNRNTNNVPSWYMTNIGSASVYTEFAQTGGAVSNTYEHRATFIPWANNSGQRPVQLAFNNSGMFIRTSSSDSAWNAWYTIYHSGNLPAYPTKSSWNYDDRYLKLIGGTITGDLTINSPDWENSYGFHINEGGSSSYGFDIVYGASDLFRIATRNGSTTLTDVLTISRGSTNVNVAGNLIATNLQGGLTYTYLRGSGTIANQAIVSNGTANGWKLASVLNVYSYTLSPGKGVRITHPDCVPALVSACRSNGDGQMILIGMGYNEAGWVRRRWRCILDSSYFHWSLPGEGSGLMSCIEVYHNASSGNATVCVWTQGNVTFTDINALTSTKDTSHILALTSDIPTVNNATLTLTAGTTSKTFTANASTNVSFTVPDVSKSTKGLCPILPNENTTTKFLRQDGTWQIPGYSSVEDWIDTVGNTKLITVNGDSDTYYPVVIPPTLSKKSLNYVSVWKNLGSTTASYSGNHSNGTSSCWYLFEGRSNQQDGNCGYWATIIARKDYADLMCHAQPPGGITGALVVWLRGGGTNYYISTTYPCTPSIYYSRTNIGTEQYTSYVEPRTATTSGNNAGKFGRDYYGGTFYGNASTASSVAWSGVSSKPATATRWPSWSEVTSKPTNFVYTDTDQEISSVKTIKNSTGIKFTARSNNGTRASFYNYESWIHGGEDNASYLGCNLEVGTWYGFGIYPTISGQTRTQGQNSFWHNARTGNTYTWGDFYKFDGTNYIQACYVGTEQTISGVKNFNQATWKVKGEEYNDITNEYFSNGKLYNNRNTAVVASNYSIRNAIKFTWYDTHWLIGNTRGGSTDTAGFVIALRDNTANNVHLIDCLRVNQNYTYLNGSIQTYISSTQSNIKLGYPGTDSFIYALRFGGTSFGASDFWVGQDDHDLRLEGYNVRIRANEVDGLYVRKTGSVGIGNTNPSYKLHVSGDIGATAFNNTSDIRKKSVQKMWDIKDEDIANAPVFVFRWKDEEDQKLHLGTSAQYWRDKTPELVSSNSEGILSLQYGVLGTINSIVLAKKLVKLRKEFENLQNSYDFEVKNLQGQINILQQQINQLRNQ